jgi:hypothetical protein
LQKPTMQHTERAVNSQELDASPPCRVQHAIALL